MASLKVFPPCAWLPGDSTMFFLLPDLLFLWASFFPKVSFFKTQRSVTCIYLPGYNNTQIDVDQIIIFH